jgi:AmmeMemoRadiSam system protein B
MQATFVREPAVAGSFYPGNAQALGACVDELLADGSRSTTHLPAVRVLVAPHAGYTYSGATAAHGFARIRSAASLPDRAFIIGPSHAEAFDFTSVFDGAAYRTPLGDVKVDQDAAQALARSHLSIRYDRAGHVTRGGRGEHAIEVMLPFLQHVAKNACIIPISMGLQSWESCAALGAAIRRIVDWRRDIMRAGELDGIFCASLKTLDARLLHDRLARGECEACGGGPVVAALLASEGLSDRACDELARSNSGEVSGDRDSVVGYVSAVVTGELA